MEKRKRKMRTPTAAHQHSHCGLKQKDRSKAVLPFVHSVYRSKRPVPTARTWDVCALVLPTHSFPAVVARSCVNASTPRSTGMEDPETHRRDRERKRGMG